MILLILICYVAHSAKYLTYLRTLRYVLKFDNLHMTQCAKIIVGYLPTFAINPSWIYGKCRQSFYLTFTNGFFILFFSRFFTFFNVFL